jgi:hypothetical protein
MLVSLDEENPPGEDIESADYDFEDGADEVLGNDQRSRELRDDAADPEDPTPKDKIHMDMNKTEDDPKDNAFPLSHPRPWLPRDYSFCRFYNSRNGCRNGQKCPHRHIDDASGLLGEGKCLCSQHCKIRDLNDCEIVPDEHNPANTRGLHRCRRESRCNLTSIEKTFNDHSAFVSRLSNGKNTSQKNEQKQDGTRLVKGSPKSDQLTKTKRPIGASCTKTKNTQIISANSVTCPARQEPALPIGASGRSSKTKAIDRSAMAVGHRPRAVLVPAVSKDVLLPREEDHSADSPTRKTSYTELPASGLKRNSSYKTLPAAKKNKLSHLEYEEGEITCKTNHCENFARSSTMKLYSVKAFNAESVCDTCGVSVKHAVFHCKPCDGLLCPVCACAKS